MLPIWRTMRSAYEIPVNIQFITHHRWHLGRAARLRRSPLHVELSTVTRAPRKLNYLPDIPCRFLFLPTHRTEGKSHVNFLTKPPAHIHSTNQRAGWLDGWRKLCHDYRLKRLFSYALLFPLACLLLHAPNWIELSLIEVVCGNDLEYFWPEPFNLRSRSQLSLRLGLIKVHSVSIRLFSERISGRRSYSLWNGGIY